MTERISYKLRINMMRIGFVYLLLTKHQANGHVLSLCSNVLDVLKHFVMKRYIKSFN